MDEARQKQIEAMADEERNIFPLPYDWLPKDAQVDKYLRETAQRSLFWTADDLDVYARHGEDFLRKHKLKATFTNDLYKTRIGIFRAVADERFCNEFGLTLQRIVEHSENVQTN